MAEISDPKTRYINHKISPPDEIVRWLALPKSRSDLKSRRDVGRLVAMDWGNYPVSTSPSEIQERKDIAESNSSHSGSKTDGEKANDTLADLIEFGPGASSPSIIAARYQGADSLHSGALVGSVGPLPNKELEAPSQDKIHLVIGRDSRDEDSTENGGEVLDVVPVPPNLRQKESKGDGVAGILRRNANEQAVEAVEEILETGLTREYGENSNGRSDSEIGYYLLQAVELNRDTHWIRHRDFPLFASIQHRGTTNGWNKGSDHLRAAYSIGEISDLNGLGEFYERVNSEAGLRHPSGISWTELHANEERSEISGPVALLSDGQLEALCNEFLRGGAPVGGGDRDPTRQYDRVYNTYPVGGALADVDILAAGTDSEDDCRVEIAAQVSFETDSHMDKVGWLLAWEDGIKQEAISQDVWYFGPTSISDDISTTELDEDRFVSVEDLPDMFRESEILDESVLDSMFTIPPMDSISIPEK